MAIRAAGWKLAKYLGIAAIVVILIFAFFNLRLGFGAQAVDCIDAKIFVVRMEIPKAVNRGDYVTFEAARGEKIMGPRFDGHLIVKKVGGLPGDRIQIRDLKLYINDEYVGPLDVADKAAKELKVTIDSFNRTEIVPEGKYFLIGTKPRTYDGRYWGFVPGYDIQGSVYPII